MIPVSAPGILNGAVRVSSTTQLGGFDVNLLNSPYHDACLSTTLLAGFRYLNLHENVQIEQATMTAVPLALPFGTPLTVPAGSQLYINDRFQTSNQFIGGQIGGRIQGQFGFLTLGIQGKLAVGATVQSVKIDGSTAFVNPAAGGGAIPQGLLAQASNIGTHTRSAFSVVPELGVDLGWNVTRHLQLVVGYNFLYWSNVLRPGGQIDPAFNTNGTRPAVPFHNEGFWAQGLSFGVKILF